MPGLLSDEQQQQQRNMGLLNIGLALMQPYNRMQGLGGHIGSALAAGNQAMQQYPQQAMEQQQFQMQIEEHRRKQAEAERMSQARSSFRQNLPDADRPLYDLDPGKYLEKRMYKDPKFQAFGGGIFETSSGLNKVGEVPVQTPFGFNPDGSMIPGYEAGKTRLARAGASSVKVDNYPNPVAVMGPDGQARMVQFTKQGDIRETDYKPYNEKSAEDKQKRSTQSRTVLDIIGEAEPLIDKATGSYAGAALDAAGRVIGESSTGAQAIAQLKALEGALMMNQPRMEGPQSNMDVELYRQMAAKIGDPVVPRAEKKAALQTVRGLHEKYLGINQGGEQQGRPSLDAFQR